MCSEMFKMKNGTAKPACPQAARALQIALIGFFGLAGSFLLAVYLVAPSIYVQVLLGHEAAADTRPAYVTAFIVAILLLVVLLVVGVLRRWRWVFWLVLVAFTAQIIAVPIDVLQLAGVMSLPYPVWYETIRLAVSILQIGIGVWMIWLYRRCGVWALGGARRENAPL
jgi:hypothetical protein